MAKRKPRNVAEELTRDELEQRSGPIPPTTRRRESHHGMEGPRVTIERPEPDVDEQEDEDEERVSPETAQDAAGGAETPPAADDTATGVGATETPTEPGPEAAVDVDLGETPALSTDHEYAAYTCGYRAGCDDPGWLLTLGELRRHLGSFFHPEEEEAFKAISPEDFWTRWGLGYADAVTKRTARTKLPPQREDMDW